jgi:hypothetical protein
MVDLSHIKPQHLWYIVGLIVTDGNLNPKKHMINITSKDEDHIVLLREILGLHTKISFKGNGGSKEKRYSALQFCDKNFYSYLENCGLSPRKSLTMKEIKVDKKYFVDFLRGVIDGDGCISTWINKTNGYQQWALRIVSAAPVFIQWLKDKTENQFNVKGKLYCYQDAFRKNPINILKFGKLAAKAILEKTYYPNCLSLERKNIKSAWCLQDPSLMVNYGGVLGPGAVTG